MWQTSASIEIKTTPDTIWERWSTPQTWNEWDQDVEWCQFDDTFKNGGKGKLKPVGGPPVKFTLTSVEKHKSFTDVAKLPLAKLIFDHELEALKPGITKVTHTVSIQGPLAFLFKRIMGKQIQNGLPHALKALAKITQK